MTLFSLFIQREFCWQRKQYLKMWLKTSVPSTPLSQDLRNGRTNMKTVIGMLTFHFVFLNCLLHLLDCNFWTGIHLRYNRYLCYERCEQKEVALTLARSCCVQLMSTMLFYTKQFHFKKGLYNIPVLIILRQHLSFEFKLPLKTLPKLNMWLKEVSSLYFCGRYQCKIIVFWQKIIHSFFWFVFIFISIV